MKRRLTGWAFFMALAALAFGLAGSIHAQEAPKQAEPGSSSSAAPAQAQPHGLGGQVVREEEESHSTEHLKKSSSIQWIARVTGLSVDGAYWLSVVFNFAIIFLIVFWASRKYLPGIFRDRTASIQGAMAEARRASEDANRRLADIELRLSKLGDEIAGMKKAGEQDMAAEEARIKAAAEEDGRKIVEAAELEIAAAAKAARRDLTAYAADLAVSLAKRQIHIDPSTDEGLVRSFADRLANEGSKN